MPIDIALGANTPVGTLELRAAQPLPNDAGFAALLVVRSGSFAAALPFFVSRESAREFTDAVAGMMGGTAASARLSAREGPDFVDVAHDAESVVVSGELSEDEGAQRLTFRFVTRASGLASLHEGLRRLLGG